MSCRILLQGIFILYNRVFTVKDPVFILIMRKMFVVIFVSTKNIISYLHKHFSKFKSGKSSQFLR